MSNFINLVQTQLELPVQELKKWFSFWTTQYIVNWKILCYKFCILTRLFYYSSNNFQPSGTKYVAYQGHPGTDMKLYNVTESNKLMVPTCGLKDFQLWHLSPVITTRY